MSGMWMNGHLHDEIELEGVEVRLVLGAHAQGGLQHTVSHHTRCCCSSGSIRRRRNCSAAHLKEARLLEQRAHGVVQLEYEVAEAAAV